MTPPRIQFIAFSHVILKRSLIYSNETLPTRYKWKEGGHLQGDIDYAVNDMNDILCYDVANIQTSRSKLNKKPKSKENIQKTNLSGLIMSVVIILLKS
jgi:hypothetical protein